MALTFKTVHVRPESELDHMLDEVEERTFLLERNGVHYFVTRLEDASERETELEDTAEPPRLRVVVGEDIWAGYDPERVRAAIDATSGSWSDIDAEELKAHIYQSRAEGSKPPIKP